MSIKLREKGTFDIKTRKSSLFAVASVAILNKVLLGHEMEGITGSNTV